MAALTPPAVPGGLPPDQVTDVPDTVFDRCLLLEPVHATDGTFEDFRVVAANASA